MQKISKKANMGAVLAVIIFLVVLVSLFALFSYLSIDKISEIKNEEHIGDDVKVKGIVKNTVKIGQLSGFSLEDDSSSIAVSSKELPREGDTVTVKGTLMKDAILGYYIKVD